MSYNYDLDYLNRNVELVRQLLDAWRSGKELVFRRDSSTEVATSRNTIRGLLANIATNYPEHSAIRTQLITWVTRDEHGAQYLHVGTHRPKQRGGRPPEILHGFEKTSPTPYGLYDAETDSVRYPEIVSLRNVPGLINYLRTEGKHSKTDLIVEVEGIDLDMFQEIVKPWDYRATELGPTTMQLKRTL